MADYAAKIAQARKAGYSDAEIVGFLSKSDQKVQQAKAAGYNDTDIIGYLSPAKAAAKPAATPAVKSAAKPPAKPTAGQFASGLGAALGRGLLIADELQGATRAARNVLAGESKVDPVKLLGVVANYNNPVAARRAFEESGAGAALRTGMAQQRAGEDRFTATNPKSAALARGTGNALTMLVPGGQVGAAMQGGRAMNMLRGATAAAAPAAAMSFADRGNLQERLGAANQGALVGGLLGAAPGAISAARQGVANVQGRMSQSAARRAPVDREALGAAKTAAYRAVDASGTRYTPEAMDDLISNVQRDVTSARINPKRHPKAASMVEDIASMKGQSPTITELDQLRQVIRRDVANSTDDAEAFFGNKIINTLDDFIDNAGGAQAASGNAEEAAGLIREARDLNTRYRKVQSVDDALERARLRTGSTGSGGNIDNATRQELRRVLEKTRNLTEDESALLEKIVLGTPGQNLLRNVGKLSPQGSGLMLAGQLGTAIPTGGASVLVGAAGAGAKAGADAITRARVAELVQLMASGGKTPQAQQAARELQALGASSPEVAALYNQLASRLGYATQQNMLSASVPR